MRSGLSKMVMDSVTRCLVFILLILSCIAALQSTGSLDIQFDWRKKGVISPVRDQGAMGNVMVFAKTEEVESMHAIHDGYKLILLSINQTIDCCNNMDPHFSCIKNLGGLCSAKDYGPERGSCPHPPNCTQYGQIQGTMTLASGLEQGMVTMIYVCPLLAYINAAAPSFQTYSSGIYSDPACNNGSLNHIVQVVGYGRETAKDGASFWIIKNSWGPTWGIDGYMYLEKGANRCRIADHVFLPISKKD